MDLGDIIKPGGRIDQARLLRFFHEVNRDVFLSTVICPFLVGKVLFEGEFSKASGPQGTVMFNPKEILKQQDTQEERKDLGHAIYVLFKDRISVGASSVFRVGRISENDLVMPDYSISKHHAQFRFSGGKYFLQDSKSTNGTQLNGKKMDPKESKELHSGDIVAFGRYSFFYLTPVQLLEKLSLSG